MNKQVSKKLISLFICVLFILSFSLSVLLILNHAEHNCPEHDCSTCTQLQNTKNLIEQLAVVGAGFISFYASLITIWNFLQSTSAKVILLTPVSSKIRMNH